MIRGSVAAAVLFTGLAAAKGAAVATSITLEPAAPIASTTQPATGSSATGLGLGAGSSNLLDPCPAGMWHYAFLSPCTDIVAHG
ncbi:hypothetical protein [Nocardia sp. NPDC004711]